jgi:hypothetical protein
MQKMTLNPTDFLKRNVYSETEEYHLTESTAVGDFYHESPDDLT